MAARYALYYAPHKDEPLYRLMAPLFGRDCRDGSRLPEGGGASCLLADGAAGFAAAARPLR